MPHADEPSTGARFEFGANWTRFLRALNDDRVKEAVRSLQSLLGLPDLAGRSFLDVGCGSGLFSLAARRLGARVRSFDYDPASVACTRELRQRYCPDDPGWEIGEGSILDVDFMRGLGTHDVVYSWGVLHHTGRMWQAIENVIIPVAPGGCLALALYNHQPLLTAWWRMVKLGYQGLPPLLRPAYVLPFFGYVVAAGVVADLARGRHPGSRYRGLGRRGMSPWYDAVDWVGGWPFETALPSAVLDFVQGRGLAPVRCKTVGHRHGCNQFVFSRGAT